jgi:hypothetical protein
MAWLAGTRNIGLPITTTTSRVDDVSTAARNADGITGADNRALDPRADVGLLIVGDVLAKPKKEHLSRTWDGSENPVGVSTSPLRSALRAVSRAVSPSPMKLIMSV